MNNNIINLLSEIDDDYITSDDYLILKNKNNLTSEEQEKLEYLTNDITSSIEKMKEEIK